MLAAYAPLPFAFAHLGWPAGIIFLGLAGLVTWYTSLLLASLDRHDGHRHVRYCDLAGSIYGAHLPYGSPCHLQRKGDLFSIPQVLRAVSAFCFCMVALIVALACDV